MQVTLADDHTRSSDVRIYATQVRLGNRTAIVDLIDLPGAADNTTPLDIDDLTLSSIHPRGHDYMERPDR